MSSSPSRSQHNKQPKNNPNSNMKTQPLEPPREVRIPVDMFRDLTVTFPYADCRRMVAWSDDAGALSRFASFVLLQVGVGMI